jgi:hypothetical protein
MKPWNFWFHVTNSTYATWLRGDGRGWRDRYHRVHVEGDYKDPPPKGLYEPLHARSQAALAREPVVLTFQQRLVACRAMADAFSFHHIDFGDLAVGAKHFHLVAQFPPDRVMQNGRPILDPARHFTGIAKKESAREMSRLGMIAPGGAWAAKAHPIPIENEDHFRYVRDQYIPRHASEGAAVYSIHVLGAGRAGAPQ